MDKEIAASDTFSLWMNTNHSSPKTESTIMHGIGNPNDMNPFIINLNETDGSAYDPQEPYEGMEFKFYNLCVYRIGFSMRKCYNYLCIKYGMITRYLLVCSGEGQCQAKSKVTENDSSGQGMSTPQKEEHTIRLGVVPCSKISKHCCHLTGGK